MREVPTPARPLYRIGWAPDPLAWPPRWATGAGRFDDPRRRFSVLYLAEQRWACFVEVLAAYRPDLPTLSRQAATNGDAATVPTRTLPASWRTGRRLGRLRLVPGQRWLDLRVVETREILRAAFAPSVLAAGLSDLDGSAIRGPQRPLTQSIAAWAYDRGYHGLAYTSRFDDRWTCWAVFEGAAVTPVGAPRRLRRDDPDLALTAALFHFAP